MKKSNLNEIKRMQQLAGINESQLNEWRIDLAACVIEDDELDRYGDYDPEINIFEVEQGSDAMADYFTDASGGDEWMENDKLAEALMFRWKQNLRKTVDRVYGHGTEIEFI